MICAPVVQGRNIRSVMGNKMLHAQRYIKAAWRYTVSAVVALGFNASAVKASSPDFVELAKTTALVSATVGILVITALLVVIDLAYHGMRHSFTKAHTVFIAGYVALNSLGIIFLYVLAETFPSRTGYTYLGALIGFLIVAVVIGNWAYNRLVTTHETYVIPHLIVNTFIVTLATLIVLTYISSVVLWY